MVAKSGSERRSGNDRRQQNGVRLGQARGWLVAVGMAVAGAGGGTIGKQTAETGMTQREADKLIAARDRYEGLMYDCLSKRIDDGKRR